MATVTSFTSARMLEIEQSAIVAGAIDLAGRLQLQTRGGQTIDAGTVRGADATALLTITDTISVNLTLSGAGTPASPWNLKADVINATASNDGLMPKADKLKLDNAVSAGTASRLMIRDASGRAQVATPSAAADISTKAYVDGRTPTVTTAADGLMIASDKALLDTATSSPTGNALVRRHATGTIQVETGSSSKDAANKAFVEAHNVLWTGAVYMNESQSVTYTGGQTVLAQKSGIVLCWSAYEDGASSNYSWNYQFVPKWHVTTAAGTGVYTIMHRGAGTTIQKYVYIGNTAISGNASNGTAPNNMMVLRAVIGV